MRKKWIKGIATCALVFGIASAVHAEEIVTFTDENIIFDYMPEEFCSISFLNTGEKTNYVCLTKMKEDELNIYAGIMIYDIASYEKTEEIDSGTWKEHYFSDFENEFYKDKVILEGDYPEIETIYQDDGCVGYKRLIGSTDKDFAVAICRLNEDEQDASKMCRMIYDTAKVTDGYLKNGCITNEENRVGYIYRNVVLSEQGNNYAKEAIDVLEGYLSFKIDADDASKQIEDIKNRSESYAETSEYVYDSNINTELSTTVLDIDRGDDESIMKTV